MLYKIINTYADESDFILNLIDDHPYIGWYMLLRLGESDTTKATLTRRECIEIIRKDGSYARNIFSYVYKAVDITVGNIQEKADSIFGTAYEHILLNGLEILSRFASIANITEQKKLVVLMIKIIDADVVRRYSSVKGTVTCCHYKGQATMIRTIISRWEAVYIKSYYHFTDRFYGRSEEN